MRSSLFYLVKALGDLYVLAFLLRFLLQWVRADFYNPLTQAIVQLTDPLVRPARRFIPTSRSADIPTLVVLMVLEALLTWFSSCHRRPSGRVIGTLSRVDSLPPHQPDLLVLFGEHHRLRHPELDRSARSSSHRGGAGGSERTRPPSCSAHTAAYRGSRPVPRAGPDRPASRIPARAVTELPGIEHPIHREGACKPCPYAPAR